MLAYSDRYVCSEGFVSHVLKPVSSFLFLFLSGDTNEWVFSIKRCTCCLLRRGGGFSGVVGGICNLCFCGLYGIISASSLMLSAYTIHTALKGLMTIVCNSARFSVRAPDNRLSRFKIELTYKWCVCLVCSQKKPPQTDGALQYHIHIKRLKCLNDRHPSIQLSQSGRETCGCHLSWLFLLFITRKPRIRCSNAKAICSSSLYCIICPRWIPSRQKHFILYTNCAAAGFDASG